MTRQRLLLARQTYPWGLLGGAVAWWGMLVGAMWCAAKAILLAFAHSYANLDFHPAIPWLVLIQAALYAGLLWSLRRTFRREGKPHLWQVYPTIFLTISATLSCFGVLAHNVAREAAPPEARLWRGHLSLPFLGPGLPDFPAVSPLADDGGRPSSDAMAALDTATPRVSPQAHPAAMRRLGRRCRDLAGDPLRFKLLVALLALPIGMVVNRDLLRGHFQGLAPEGGLLLAAAWLVAILPALALGWGYGYLIGWMAWAALANAASIVAYRVSAGHAATDGA